MTRQPDSQNSPRVEFQVQFRTGQHGRIHLRERTCQKDPDHPNEDLPRLTRLLALAHRWERLISEGVVSDRAEIARAMGLTRPRVTQIMNLLLLAPAIQEDILAGTISISERQIRCIASAPEWKMQHKLLNRIAQ